MYVCESMRGRESESVGAGECAYPVYLQVFLKSPSWKIRYIGMARAAPPTQYTFKAFILRSYKPFYVPGYTPWPLL